MYTHIGTPSCPVNSCTLELCTPYTCAVHTGASLKVSFEICASHTHAAPFILDSLQNTSSSGAAILKDFDTNQNRKGMKCNLMKPCKTSS